ncbi:MULTISPECIES: hypothetical protein [unclassified Rhizobium]|uniref:hypothetical protein n=1 Tax=unclassified Rhizobium TaxID=2613769 RepID=UPI00068B1FE5|nr:MULTISPECIES: hypothetical protein [unclassified Rhizobium]MBN8949097.1 hypothetical protein [Rhizobium tropici]
MAAGVFPHAVVRMARDFIFTYESCIAVAALFASHQSWLLCHAALAHYFPGEQFSHGWLTRRVFGMLAVRHNICSRNTATTLFSHAIERGALTPLMGIGDIKLEQAVPSPAAMTLLTSWYRAHFEALDLIDGGDRAMWLLADPVRSLALIQFEVACALLCEETLRAPGPLYTIFTWADSGSLLMDRLIGGIDVTGIGRQDRHQTTVSSLTWLAQSSGLSRAHTSRKMSAAERIGGIGWTGRRGRSELWVSQGFYEEYARVQVCKLLILDEISARARFA